jgi:transposase
VAARRRQPAEICGDRPGQRHAGQLLRRHQARGDDLAVVEPQLGQLIQTQFEEMHAVWSPVPDAAGGARGEQRVPREADLLGQLAPCRYFRRLTVPDTDQNSTIIAVIEMSQSSWLVAGMLPGIERQPRKKLEPSPERLLGLLHGWRDEAVSAGRTITRIALAFEAGRDGFWLARWLAARGIEAHVIHASSVAVSREHRRAKTDRLDTELLKRGFLGWLRGERGHCSMARVPTIAEEDAKRPNRERDCLVGERTRIVNRIKSTLARLGIRNFKPTLRKAAERLATVHTPEGMPLPPNTLAELQRDMARLGFVVSQIRQIEEARQKRLEQQPETGPHAMVRLLARIVGVGVETADMLVHEVLSRPMRDRRAVARYAGLTGSPDESGARRREQGLARAGNARVRRGMIQLAWRFLMFQKESVLALWYRARTADSRIGTRKTMIVALARKLIIALWRFVTTGEPLEGVVLRPAS